MEENTPIQKQFPVGSQYGIISREGSSSVGVEIRTLDLRQGEYSELTCHSNKVLLVVRGLIECAQDGYLLESVPGRSLIFIRMGIQCRITACRESLLVVLRYGNKMYQKDSSAQAYTNGVMANTATEDHLLDLPDGQMPVLPFNVYMRNFVAGLLPGILYAADAEFYAGIKICEFFFLVGMSYSERDRARFFESLDTAEQSFATFIYCNYKRAASVRELATMACYSLSGFEKRFRKIFGQPASQWIARQKALMIYTEICDTQKPFKILSYEYGFSCPSHFTRFCRKHLGKAPALIRLQKQTLSKNI